MPMATQATLNVRRLWLPLALLLAVVIGAGAGRAVVTGAAFGAAGGAVRIGGASGRGASRGTAGRGRGRVGAGAVSRAIARIALVHRDAFPRR